MRPFQKAVIFPETSFLLLRYLVAHCSRNLICWIRFPFHAIIEQSRVARLVPLNAMSKSAFYCMYMELGKILLKTQGCQLYSCRHTPFDDSRKMLALRTHWIVLELEHESTTDTGKI